MPHRFLLVAAIPFAPPIALFGGIVAWIYAVNADGIVASMLIIAGGVAVAIVRLTPAIAGLIDKVGPSVLSFRKSWLAASNEIKARATTIEAKATAIEAKATTIEAKASTIEAVVVATEARATASEARATTTEARAATTEGNIQILTGKVETLVLLEADRVNVISLQQAEIAHLARQFAAMSLAYAAQVGLITPVADVAVFDDPAALATPDARGAVLVVEDDPYTVNAYRGLFRRLGIKTYFVADADAAIARLGEGPDCVILDLVLPGDGGEVVLRRIRQDSLPVRVVVTTGVDDADRFRSLRALGPDAILTKPIVLESLIAAVRGPRPVPGAPGR